MSKVKGSSAKGPSAPPPSAPAPSAKGKFEAKAWARDGVSEEEVNSIKQAFDLFDTDQGGSIDIKGTDYVS